MNIEKPVIFASKSHLKRNWILQNRIMAYKNSYEHTMKKIANINDYCLVVVQRFINGQWTDQIYYAPLSQTVLSLQKQLTDQSPKSGDSYFFFTPKTKTQIGAAKTFKQLYDNYKDPDDNFVYLVLGTMNSFG